MQLTIIFVVLDGFEAANRSDHDCPGSIGLGHCSSYDLLEIARI